MKRNRKIAFTLFAILAISMVTALATTKQLLGGFNEFWGPLYSAPAQTDEGTALLAQRKGSLDVIRRWNQIAIDASGLDHRPVAAGENRVFGEQLGPGRASYAMAIVHIAMFEAINAIKGDYQSYTGLYTPAAKTSKSAAIPQAAHDTLVALFPSQKPTFDQALAEDLSAIADKRAKRNGIALGKQAAFSILAMRFGDGSERAEPRVGIEFITSSDVGKWRQDPISRIPLALGAFWGEVKPFILESGSQFRVPPPPALDSAAFAAAYNEVKRLGGDGVTTPTERTQDQTDIGIFWAYDGVPNLCAPPRLYNQIAVQIADQMKSNDIELARLLALINVAMADAGIAIWESKYFHNVCRPITGIREDAANDNNAATAADLNYMPLGAPASNLTGPNFTPPFPAYPSGHAGFGGALFQILRKFYGTDNIAFTFVSDELNGVTKDNSGVARALKPRSFTNLSQPEEENGQSRIYLGIHWAFDKTEGIAQGRRIADYVFENAFVPLR